MEETDSWISVELPVEKEFARLLRLLVSGIAARMNFDFDSVDDLKIAVEEVYLMVLQQKDRKSLKIVFDLKEDRLEIDFKDVPGVLPETGNQENNMGRFILDAVVDEIQTIGANGTKDLRLTKIIGA